MEGKKTIEVKIDQEAIANEFQKYAENEITDNAWTNLSPEMRALYRQKKEEIDRTSRYKEEAWPSAPDNLKYWGQTEETELAIANARNEVSRVVADAINLARELNSELLAAGHDYVKIQASIDNAVSNMESGLSSKIMLTLALHLALLFAPAK